MTEAAGKGRPEGQENPWKWIGLGLVLVAIIVAGRTLPIERWPTEFDQWILAKGPEGLLIFTAGYAAATVLLIPGSLLTMATGFAFGIFWGITVATVGSAIGDTIAFLIARYLARENIRRFALRNHKFTAMDDAIGEHGWKIVLLLRLSPLIPFNMSNYLYGLTAIRFWPYVFASVAGTLPANLVFVYVGAAGKAGLMRLTNPKAPHSPLELTLLAIGFVTTCLATWYIHRIASRALQKSRPARQ